MSCTSCYSGCVDVTSDECVKYTGAASVPLDIEYGDNLLTVETALINKVVSFLDGTGIKITVNPSYYCTLVSQYLVGITTPTVPQLFSALVRAACNLQTQTTANAAAIATLNADYTITCLTGVTASSDTHEIVQAVINKVCSTATALTALTLDVNTNYVKLSEVDSLIAAYLASHSGGTTQFYQRMIPYTVVEYYGPLTNFDGTGAGLASAGYSKIFLCNGLNGTPDKRGRVGVGAIKNVPGGPLDAAVNPTASSFNPNYTVYATGGANSVILNTTQLPAHTHSATGTTTVTLADHFHFTSANSGGVDQLVDSTHAMINDIGLGGNSSYRLSNSTTTATTGKTNLAKSEVTSNVPNNVSVINQSTGGGQAHSNTQPVLACYYIMYIPS